MPAPAKAIRASLDPDKGRSSHSIADFGRLPLAPLHAATAGLASSAMGVKDYSRFNLSALTSKVAAAAKCHDKNSKAKMNVTTSDLNLHMAGLAHHLFKEMSARPDEYQSEIGMFAPDEEKASMYSKDRFFLTAIGRAEQEATGSAPSPRTAYENTEPIRQRHRVYDSVPDGKRPSTPLRQWGPTLPSNSRPWPPGRPWATARIRMRTCVREYDTFSRPARSRRHRRRSLATDLGTPRKGPWTT